METVGIVVVVVAGLAIVLLVVSWFVQSHPEEASDHEFTEDEGAGPTGTPYVPGSRPGGPGAESMAVPEAGDTAPGGADTSADEREL
jgi:hypothetical protein